MPKTAIIATQAEEPATPGVVLAPRIADGNELAT